MAMLQDLIPESGINMDIKGLTTDSRKVEAGFLFAALVGAKVDGRDFIAQAVGKGAVAVLLPSGSDISALPDCHYIFADNARKTFAHMAAAFYARQPQFCAAVTGTNGKSSVVTFVRQLWTMLGHKAASLGTLGITAPGLEISGGLTTPDPAGLHERLSEVAALGVTHLAMEASSHGLDQHRMDGVKVSVAGFTNLSRDHLDYHRDMAEYLGAKKRLFTDLLSATGTAVLNADCPEYQDLCHALSATQSVISYGKDGKELHFISAHPSAEGQDISIKADGTIYELKLPLAGYFQTENALCAAGMVIASGHGAKEVLPLLERLEGVPGRMEAMGGGVFVDYAHTPDALETVLKALRAHSDGKLAVLFGCGGDRDRGKRPQMGAIAAKFADTVYVSDDNPRSENPDTIRAEIMAACPAATEIGDRKLAIQTAIKNLEEGDILLIAGKGHETGQIIGDQVLPFDDRALAKACLDHD